MCDVMNMENFQSSVVRPIAPEDIREGDYLAVLHVVHEQAPLVVPAEGWSNASRSMEPMRVTMLPCGDNVPLKVEAVCLPFVLVKAPLSPAARAFGFADMSAPTTLLRTLDVRRYRFARLPEEYGRRVYRMLKRRGERKQAGAYEA
jgi:hypothetical protein